ncbi:multifunctional CCA addition/repair protein [Burkholderia ambifaria]|uniref:multifunctional CCA addition/repair protein n=1 Tax=Burkholderia ambifaria TaxID=152480 RepID=UPI000F8077B0|nr:multifunctional CCA addition/repair protein [Burkholderia ambifaria]
MQILLVGGVVRDSLMGHPVRDRDYVVVGATPEQMLALGYQQVGADFPVFLHPKTREEYALARTQRSSAGVGGTRIAQAAPDVTLEQDLGRRDLTINAMAMTETGEIVDPYGGQSDLAARVLRHVCDESFAEDPVRVLRLARFAARYRDFMVAPETMAFVSSMVQAGALDHLVAERVWQELAKGMMEHQPSRMFELLREMGVLKVLLPELDVLWGIPQPADHHPEVDTGVHVMMVLDATASAGASLDVRFAALMHDLGKGVTPAEHWPRHHDHERLGVPLVKAVCARLRVPTACRDLALIVCQEHTLVHGATRLQAATVVRLLSRMGALRRPERLDAVLLACECDARGRLGFEHQTYPQADRLRAARAAIGHVNAGDLARACKSPTQIAERLHAARVNAVKRGYARLEATPSHDEV